MTLPADLFQRHSWLTRCLTALALLILLRPPLVENWQFALLLLATFALIYLPIRTLEPQRLRLCAVWLAAALAAQWLPRPAIEEGHQIFLHQGAGEPLQRQLPAGVYQFLESEFDRVYPPAGRCDPVVSGCWRQSAAMPQGWAFSADGIWQQARYSRVVDRIDFNSLVALRAGFVNELAYNFYRQIYKGDPPRSDIVRESMPYFVMFELNPRLAGSTLCWQGHLLWERADGGFDHLPQAREGCHQITAEDAGRRVFGVQIDHTPAARLSMRLDLNHTLSLAALARACLTLLAVLSLLRATLCWRPGPLWVPVAGALAIGWVAYSQWVQLFGMYIIYEGGHDGLLHEGMGRAMLRALLSGHWGEVLRGGESVYYFMPGLRYFKIPERLLFGDTHFGYLWAMLLAPAAVYAVARRVANPLLVVLLLILLHRIGFNHIVMEAGALGYPDALGAILFLSGLALLLRAMAGTPPSVVAGFIGHLVLALAVMVRPNLLPGAGLLTLAVLYLNLRAQGWYRALQQGSGFLLVLWLPLHNALYGQVFVPLTAAAGIKENLLLTPAIYLDALRELLQWRSGDNLRRILIHWPWLHHGRAAKLLMMAAAITVACIGLRHRPLLAALAWTTLGLHSVFLLYSAEPRYAILAWAMLFITSAGALHWGITVAWRRLERSPRLAPHLERLLRVLPQRPASGGPG